MQLCQVDGIGEVVAQGVEEFFDTKDNRDFIERLREVGLQMAIDESDAKPQTSRDHLRAHRLARTLRPRHGRGTATAYGAKAEA